MSMLPDELLEIIPPSQRQMAETYARGFADGCESALTLLLGIPMSGAEPFRGEVSAEIREWAEAALARIRR